MKIHLYGNILNNSYNLTQFLRAKGFEAEMFLDDSSPFGQDYPWWEDKQWSPDNLPSWIHYYKVKPNFLLPQPELKRMISEFSKCDIALVCGWGPIIAQRAKVPYFFYSYGSDLFMAFFWENIIGAIRKILRFKKPTGLRSILLFTHIQRRAIQNADRIGIMMEYQVNPYVKPLKLLGKMDRIRLSWDIDKYVRKCDEQLASRYKQYDLVYFMMARHAWKSVWNDLKGNDKFIRAFARFVKGRDPNVRLVMIEKGEDVEASKELVLRLGLTPYVEWVKEMNKDGIRSYISVENVVVVDQFWHDRWRTRYPENPTPGYGLGSASIEALSAGRLVLSGFFHEQFYEGNRPPMLIAFSEQEIYDQLCQSLRLTPAERKDIGRMAYDFVKKYHGWENTIDTYVDISRKILAQRRKEQG